MFYNSLLGVSGLFTTIDPDNTGMFYNSLLGVSGLFTTIDPDNTGYVLQ